MKTSDTLGIFAELDAILCTDQVVMWIFIEFGLKMMFTVIAFERETLARKLLKAFWISVRNTKVEQLVNHK